MTIFAQVYIDEIAELEKFTIKMKSLFYKPYIIHYLSNSAIAYFRRRFLPLAIRSFARSAGKT
jgi:hypothetical protein